ncbi:GtrA family protein [Actinospica sp.]|uniref:GtrA family protein n=1 Tax=Actinospica sp. TaxID=1872142 RepID=UPI002C67CF15|nr:GtrA family protein [Actinospica sp.]HWG27440.1 GtrA family protein [Actinospica sp.]
MAWLVALVRRLWRELLGFGVVGAVGYVSDAIVINLLYHHVPSVLASAIAVCVSTVIAYLGNRFWTFRHRERRETGAEFGLFALVSAGGFLIAVSCVWFTEHVLGADSRLAVNIAQLGAGQVLGTLFRFWACHEFVFPERPEIPTMTQCAVNVVGAGAEIE